MNELKRALRPVKRRMRFRRAVLGLSYGALVGAAVIVLLRAASFLWVFPSVVSWAIAAALAFPTLSALAAWLWPISDLDAARQADNLGLKARAQTAIMLNESDTPMALLQRDDALSSLRSLDPSRAMRIRPPKAAWIGIAACLCLLGISFFISNPQAEALRARTQFHAEMEKQAQKVEEGSAALDADEADTPDIRRLLGELSQKLRETSDAKEALGAVDDTERRLDAMREKTAKDALSALKSSGLETLSQALEKGDQEAAKEALEASEQAQSALSQAAAAATDATASQLLQSAAQALQTGDTLSAVQGLANACSGQSASNLQAAALAAMVRRAVAGTAAAQGSSMPNMQGAAGSGQNGGSGSSSSQGEGSGSGSGLGSSDKDGGASASSSSGASRGSAEPEKKVADYESIYDPTRMGGSGDIVNERGKNGEGEITETTIGTGAGSADGSVPYSQVLPEYSQSAVEAAQNAQLPAYAQKWIEDYFNSLAE